MDMSKFPEGPWKNEPVGPIVFEHAGMECLLRRGPLGAWCGYVVIPQNHQLYGAEMMDDECVDLMVHGGVTYSGKGINGCSDKFVIGFDCGHSGDIVPGLGFYSYDIYRDVDYATAETKKLAEQISALNESGPQPDDLMPCLGGQHAQPSTKNIGD